MSEADTKELREFLNCLLSDMRVHQADIIERSNNQKGRARNRTRRYSAAMEKFIRQVEAVLAAGQAASAGQPDELGICEFGGRAVLHTKRDDCKNWKPQAGLRGRGE